MELRTRYRGCLLAGAAGDALGYPVEFLDERLMVARFGAHGPETPGLHISDDTQMTLFTAEGMLLGARHGMPMPQCVYEAYLDWLCTQGYPKAGGCFRAENRLLACLELHHPRAPGNTCLSALGSGKMGTMAQPINHSKGCGGVMRTAPCGLLRLPTTPDTEEAFALQGAQAAAVTHTHPLGYIPAAMLADLIHRICREEGPLEELVRNSLALMERMFGAQEEFSSIILDALYFAQTDLPEKEAIRRLGEGWVAEEALAIALYCALRFQNDLEKALRAAVNHRGDSDSTGAIAGNILGAWLGEEAIPPLWLETLELRETIAQTADEMYRAACSL